MNNTPNPNRPAILTHVEEQVHRNLAEVAARHGIPKVKFYEMCLSLIANEYIREKVLSGVLGGLEPGDTINQWVNKVEAYLRER